MKAPAPMLWTRPAGRKKTSPRSDGMVAQQVADRMVGYRRGIGFGIHAAGRNRYADWRRRLRNDVPHLGLAVHPVTLPRQTVVGVYLNREILAGVDEFDQQRKFVAETFVIALSHQFGAVAGRSAPAGKHPCRAPRRRSIRVRRRPTAPSSRRSTAQRSQRPCRRRSSRRPRSWDAGKVRISKDT